MIPEHEKRSRLSTWDGRYELADTSVSTEQPTMVEVEAKTRLLSMANCSVSGGVVIDYTANDQEEEVENMSLKRRNRTVSIALIIITDVVATLQGTLLKILLGRGISLFAMLFITSFIGAIFSGCLMLIRRTPLIKDKSARKSMIERGILGGLANLCAFYAVSKLNLGVASCLMFTMPLWTALLSYIVAGQKWDKVDIALAFSCLGGVILVTQIWSVNEGVEALGFLAALGFAIINADAALVVNTKLRNEAPISMVFVTMIFGTIISGCIVLVDQVSIGMNNEMDIVLLVALSLGMPLMMLTRNLAFTLNKDTSIAMLLYLEIVLAFLWEYLLLNGGLPSLPQLFGSLLIIGGSCGSVFIKEFMSNTLNTKKSTKQDKLSFAEKFNPQNNFVIPPYQHEEGDRETYDSFEGKPPKDVVGNDLRKSLLASMVE